MNRKRKLLIWLMLLSTLISACGDAVAAAPAPRLEPCVLEQNPYTNPVETYLANIYRAAVTSMNDNGAYNINRHLAFTQLVNLVRDWTDSVVVNNGDRNIEVAITYVSPQVARAVVINHYLYMKNNDYTANLDAQVRSNLEGIIDRNEHVFFVTFITTPSSNGVTIDFPLSELELTNTSNMSVNREHDDHNLEKTITLQNEPEYGFFYFPMAVIKDGSCQPVFDETRDTSVVISASRIMINGVTSGPQSWKFKYAPLIDMRLMSDGSSNGLTINHPVDQITPTMSPLFPGNKNDPNYWISMARMIWMETTLDP